MNGGLEEVLMRTEDEVCGAVQPWLAPAVEAEVKRQLSADPASKSEGPPKLEARKASGLQITLTACGFGPKTRTRIAVEAMTAVEGALRERLPDIVRAEIVRQRPTSERAQKEFDEWAAASRERTARYNRLAKIRANGQRLTAGVKGA
jgi:hypothetical protein